MAVFKQELNWSTYQDRQIKILEAIDKSLSSSLQIGQSLANNMNKIEYAITSIAYASEASAKNVASITKELTGSAEVFTSRMDKAGSSVKDFKLQMDDSSKAAKDFRDNIREAGDSFNSVLGAISSRFFDKFVGGIDAVGKAADNFSTNSNQMIRLSGMSGDVVREFRSGVMSVISDLNKETGSLYSPKEYYDKIISVSQGVTNNLESIEEMTRPLLLSYETLDVNINTVADIFNRFYTRYTFSSTQMESTLDEIRGNTAGNSANAEATMENIKSLESWINLYAGNDNDLRESLLEEVSHYTSWVESMGLDSKALTDYINIAASGDIGSNRELVEILSRVGITSTSATIMARTGQYEELTQAIIDGVYDTMIDHFGSREEILNGGALALGPALKNIGLSEELALEILNIKDATGYISLDDFLEKQNKNPATMAELADDKYVSAADKTNNWLEQIYEKVAKIQELNPLGFGLSDVALAAALTKGILWGGSGTVGSSLLGKAGTAITRIGNNAAANLMISGSQIVGNQASVGLATGVGLAGAGLGAGFFIDGAKGVFNQESNTGTRVLSGVEAAAGAAGAGLLLASNPIGWAALLAAGSTYLVKKWYENATELSGNAKKVESDIDAIGESLQEENRRRLEEISTLSYQFDKESDVSKQRQLLEESGLFSQEELNNTADNQLKKLIESYKDATAAMGETTEALLEHAKKIYGQEQDNQQKEFVNKLGDITSSKERSDILKLLDPYIEDEGIKKKITNALKDSVISDAEWKDILDGGKNKLWDKNNFTDQVIPVDAMQMIAGFANMGMEFTSADNAGEVIKLYNSFAQARTEADKEKAREAIKKSGLEEEVKKVFGDNLSILGYSEGSNYIDHDQIAILHEGEAVVPKRYNPAANNEELKRAIEYLESTNSTASRDSESYFASFLEELQEIRAFLEEWKSYNAQKDKMNEIKSRYGTSRALISQYFT